MNACTIHHHTLRTALFLISAGFAVIPHANASELDLSTEFHAAAMQAVASSRDAIKSQLEQSIQSLFPVDASLVAAATDRDKVVKQNPSVSADELNEAS